MWLITKVQPTLIKLCNKSLHGNIDEAGIDRKLLVIFLKMPNIWNEC